MRVTAILATVILGAGLLAGCGSGEGSDHGSSSGTSGYCNQLKAAKSEFASLDSETPDFTKFSDAIATFHTIAKGAPAPVDDDWKTLDAGFTTLEKDLEDAGVSMKDLGAIIQGQLPVGMSQADVAALGPKLEATFGKLDDARFKAAGGNIEKHAKSVCHIELTKN